MKMSDVRVGMRLRSTITMVPTEEFVTVTELTPQGFKYSLDAGYPMIPRWGMAVLKDGHEHFGMNGEAFFEVVDQRAVGTAGEARIDVSEMSSEGFIGNAEKIAEAMAQQLRANGPLTREICSLVDARTR